MEEARYWMWAKRNNHYKPDPNNPLNKNNNIFCSSSVGDSWEEQAFAEDAAMGGGLVWPPRSYSCSFCRREFRSAQALGGHMNVHRRDRARLKHQSPPPPNPNPQPAIRVQVMKTPINNMSSATLSFSSPKDDEAARPLWSSFVAKSVMNNNNKRVFSEDDDEEVGSCNKKRMRINGDDENPSSFFPKLLAVERFFPEELDLELRLGTIAPKVK